MVSHVRFVNSRKTAKVMRELQQCLPPLALNYTTTGIVIIIIPIPRGPEAAYIELRLCVMTSFYDGRCFVFTFVLAGCCLLNEIRLHCALLPRFRLEEICCPC